MTELKQSFEMDSRVESYLEAVEENIGLLERGGGIKSELEDNEIEFEIVDVMTRDYAGLRGGQKMEVIEYNAQSRSGSVYAVQYTKRVGIDAVETVVLQFGEKPSKEDVKTAEAVSDVRQSFMFENLEAEYTCWECGQETHALDALNDNSGAARIKQIKEIVKDRYCGC